MQRTIYANRSELSTGFPFPLPIPHAQRKTAQVILIPIKVASTLPIAGNLVTRQRKYTELEMIDADMTSSPICSQEVRTVEMGSLISIPSSYHSFPICSRATE